MSMDKLFDGSDAHLLPEIERGTKMLTTDQIAQVWLATEGNQFDFARAIEAAVLAEQAKASADRDEAYDLIDRQLRNTLDDADYADYSAALDSLYLHHAPVPEGMVMVPREPTEAMLSAGYNAGMYSKPACAIAYRAMIAEAEKEAGK